MATADLGDSRASVALTSQQLEQYERDGYLVVEKLIDPDRVRALAERLREYTHGDRATTGLRVQVEPKVERGELKVAQRGDGIRKVEGLVEHDDLFAALGSDPAIVGPIAQIVGPDVKMFRNAALLKPPGVGSSKGVHQDAPYWPIEPMSECSCWFAIDDATPENGCMALLPGAHKLGTLPHVHVTDDYVVEEGRYATGDLVLAPLKAGGGVLFHALLPHYTAANSSGSWRRAIALSYMSAQSRYTGEGDGPTYLQIAGRSFPGCVR